MTALLTDNLPLLAGTPNGIKKLRELILELAVRGKLVPQDPNDEPASELLKRIAQEKGRLVAEGKIRKQKPLAEVGQKERLFELPSSWEWQRLDSISPMSLVDGDWIESKDQDPLGGIRLLQLADIGVNEFKDKSNRFINSETFTRLNCTALEAGDILIARLPSPIGRACIFPGLTCKAITVVDVAVLRPLSAFCSDYVVNAINSICFRQQVEAYGKGATRFRIATGHLKTLRIPMPPLAEQHRIVAKVDELMALCDRLEAQQADAESAHAQLVQAMLGSLTQAADAEDFAASWHRLAENFHTLFTTESSIDTLKQALLKVAVMGKLVPQDPNDEPAAELLNRIIEDKIRAASLNRKRQGKGVVDKSSDVAGLLAPRGWVKSTVGAVTICRDGERVPVAQAEREGRAKTYDYYGASGVIDKIDGYLFDKPLLLVGEDGANLINRSTPIAYMARGKYWVNNHAHVLDGISESLLLYVCLYFNAIDLKPYVTGTAQPKMNQAKMNAIPLLLPPEAEQHRIVAKVDQLMALCDQLKTRLTQARQLNEQLATALVEQAVA